MKRLDKLGRGSSTDCSSISEEEVIRYVLFDIEDDIRLVFGRLILRQGGKGVLIGGFRSAQLAEMWCSWRGATWGFGQSKGDVETTLKSDLAVSFPNAKMSLNLARQDCPRHLVRKGASVGERPLEEGEWGKWVNTSSPHALMVWKSHFTSLLAKCVWYACDKECGRANLRCVMWGCGA